MEKISKLEAARQQLRQAIHLFLSKGDLVAVHTLAAASLQVLSDLGAKKGIVAALKNPDLIRPDKRKFVADLFNAPQNFFKHADRDPEGVLEFYPEATPFYIADAAFLFDQLSGTKMPACQAFNVWFFLNYPDVLVESPVKGYAEKLVACDPSVREQEVAHRLLRQLESHDA